MIKPADTKRELLDAGRELFAEHGFRGTTVRSLAKRAGTNIGAVAYHFGSKEALYHAVIEEVTAPVRDRLAKEIRGTQSPLDQIESHMRATFAFLAENPDVARLVFQQLIGGGPLPPAAKLTLQMNLNRIVEFIEAGQQDGSIRPGDSGRSRRR